MGCAERRSRSRSGDVQSRRGSPTDRGTGLYHLAWEVPRIEDLPDAARVLSEASALGGTSDHGVSKSLYGADPDGNEFEILWRVPREAWGEYADKGVGHAARSRCRSPSLGSGRSGSSLARRFARFLQAPARLRADRPDPVPTILGVTESRETSMAELDTAARDRLRDSSFAYIDESGERHLPINDEGHVRSAIGRFDQTDFESEKARYAAAKRVLAAAKRHDIEVGDDAEVVRAARR